MSLFFGESKLLSEIKAINNPAVLAEYEALAALHSSVTSPAALLVGALATAGEKADPSSGSCTFYFRFFLYFIEN